MAVLQRVNLLPNQRLDTPDARALEAFSLNDWRFFIKGVLSRDSLVVQGFDISNYSQIFTTPGFKVKVSNVVLFQPENDTQASGFYTFAGTEPDITVSLSPNSNNFVEADMIVASGSPDVRAFWDQGANNNEGGEFTDTVDTVINLELTVTANITGFTTGKIPLYKVVTNSLGAVTSVTDCRPMFFRLGTGGTTPNPNHDYSWASLPDASHARMETPVTATAYTATNAPFQGGDKNILSMKEWMDAVMSDLKSIKGVPYWYMPFSSAGGVSAAYINAASIVFQNGTWQHVTNGHLQLIAGSQIVRLGLSNILTLSPFADIDLSTNVALFLLTPSTDVAVTYGFGDDGLTPVSPQDVSSVTSSTVTVGLGGNYVQTGGKILIRGFEFTYTTFTPGTGVFSGVTPDPSGLAQVGDHVYQSNNGSVGFYHFSSTDKVPGITSGVSEGAERTIWLAVYDGVSKIDLKNGDLEVGEEIEVGDNTSLNVLTYIGSPSEATTQPSYATTATGALTSQTQYNAVTGEDLTVRASRLTSMMADKAQDKTIKLLRSGIDTITNTTNGANQELTFGGASPLINVIVPSSANNGTITLSGTLTLGANQAAYFTIDRNASFSFVNLAALTVASISSVPLNENTFIFAYRTSSTRVYLYDGRSFTVGTYPGEPEIQSSVQNRIGVTETSYTAYTSTSVIGVNDSYPTALSSLDNKVGLLLSNTQLEEEQIAILGQTAFTFSTLYFSALNTVYDVAIYRNGRKLLQDPTGANTKGYIKTGINSIQVSSAARAGDSFVARVERQI